MGQQPEALGELLKITLNAGTPSRCGALFSIASRWLQVPARAATSGAVCGRFLTEPSRTRRGANFITARVRHHRRALGSLVFITSQHSSCVLTKVGNFCV